jgi:hypothetical protein
MAKSPKEAKALGPTRRIAIPPDWEVARDSWTSAKRAGGNLQGRIDQGKPSPNGTDYVEDRLMTTPVLTQLRAVENG